MRIVFMGTPSYATEILSGLLATNHEIVALFTQPDKPVGRKQELTPPHIKQFYIDKGLTCSIYQPEKLNNNEMIEVLKKLAPECMIVAAYGQLLPKDILDIAPCINLHASILPRYRGASPIQESLLSDDHLTGVTAMLMDVGLDSGDILGIKYVTPSSTCNSAELFIQLSTIAKELTIEILNNFDALQPLKQNQGAVSYCKKIKKEYGLVDFEDAKTIFLKYKAYHNWPGVFLENGMKIIEMSLYDIKSIYTKLEILQINEKDAIIGCSLGSVRIITVQPPSKQKMNIVDYLRGKRLGVGALLS